MTAVRKNEPCSDAVAAVVAVEVGSLERPKRTFDVAEIKARLAADERTRAWDRATAHLSEGHQLAYAVRLDAEDEQQAREWADAAIEMLHRAADYLEEWADLSRHDTWAQGGNLDEEVPF